MKSLEDVINSYCTRDGSLANESEAHVASPGFALTYMGVRRRFPGRLRGRGDVAFTAPCVRLRPSADEARCFPRFRYGGSFAKTVAISRKMRAAFVSARYEKNESNACPELMPACFCTSRCTRRTLRHLSVSACLQ